MKGKQGENPSISRKNIDKDFKTSECVIELKWPPNPNEFWHV